MEATITLSAREAAIERLLLDGLVDGSGATEATIPVSKDYAGAYDDRWGPI